MLSSAGCRSVGVAADVDQLVGLALLASPLQVVIDADVEHPEINAHMAFVGIPFAEIS